jgi:hypothetical protein
VTGDVDITISRGFWDGIQRGLQAAHGIAVDFDDAADEDDFAAVVVHFAKASYFIACMQARRQGEPRPKPTMNVEPTLFWGGMFASPPEEAEGGGGPG